MKPRLSYTPQVLSHFKKPHNYGKIKNAEGIGQVGNLLCGDVMKLYLRIDSETEIIKDIKFETLGCAAAIATSSIITDLAKNKTLKQALKINNSQIISSLGDLPPAKIHCSVLAADALAEAVYDYYSKTKKAIPKSLRQTHKHILNKHATLCSK